VSIIGRMPCVQIPLHNRSFMLTYRQTLGCFRPICFASNLFLTIPRFVCSVSTTTHGQTIKHPYHVHLLVSLLARSLFPGPSWFLYLFVSSAKWVTSRPNHPFLLSHSFHSISPPSSIPPSSTSTQQHCVININISGKHAHKNVPLGFVLNDAFAEGVTYFPESTKD